MRWDSCSRGETDASGGKQSKTVLLWRHQAVRSKHGPQQLRNATVRIRGFVVEQDGILEGGGQTKMLINW